MDLNRPPVLLVEDDENDAILMQRAFRKAGLQSPIIRAKDGLDALVLFKEHPPSLVLCDLKMPKLGGLDFLEQLGGLESDIGPTVVILSASRQNADLKKAYRFGADFFLLKPSDFYALVQIANAIREATDSPQQNLSSLQILSLQPDA